MSLEIICLGLLRIRKIVIRMTTRMKQKKISVKKNKICVCKVPSPSSLEEELHLRKCVECNDRESPHPEVPPM